MLFKGIEGALHQQVDGLPVGDVDVPDAATEPLVLPLSVAASRFPELVEGRLGTVVDDADPFVARNQEAWTGGAFVYVPRGVSSTPRRRSPPCSRRRTRRCRGAR